MTISGAAMDSAPVFCVFIDSSGTLHIVDIALEISGVSPLSIRFSPNPFTTASSFMGKVVPHIKRWKVAELRDTAWEYLPQTSAPRLQELILIPNKELPPALARGALCEESSSLQRLTLHHVYLTGPLPTFGRNLRFLTIRQLLQRDDGITYTEIHRLLLLHYNLVEVDIQASHWSQATPNPEMIEDVSPPTLRRFSLGRLGYDDLACLRLLEKITAPNCISFELDISNVPETFPDLLRAVEPYFASVVTTVSRDLTLSLDFVLYFSLTIGRGDETFKLRGWIPSPPVEFGWVVDMLIRYRPNVTDLELETFWALPDEGLSDLFMALLDVTQSRSKGGLEAAWNVLGKPAVPGAERGAAQWLLPALVKLTVLDQSGMEGERFIAMIQAREAAATDTDPTHSLARHRFIRLKRVEYRGLASL
ncbi:hypothetical protein FS837_009322 [Tulasnella sp. UAMH 9824]|nr:hypothetical protein FS837_009322 [Tulasnella sp. UAMH 9824]